MEKKFHIGKNGPAVCKASVKSCRYAEASHFSSMEEARTFFEQNNDNKKFYKISKEKTQGKNNDNTEVLLSTKKMEALKNFTANGFLIGTANEMKLKFYHTSTDPQKVPRVGEINDVSKNNTDGKDFMGSFLHKPEGALWLSTGEENNDGKIVTSWSQWCATEDFRKPSENTMYEIEFNPQAIILEIDENNVKNIDKAINPAHGEEWVKTKDMSFLNLSGSYENDIDWDKLKKSGVDAVRINGGKCRKYFYGWDVDSMIVLNGKSVKNVIPCEPETNTKNIEENYINFDKDLF